MPGVSIQAVACTCTGVRQSIRNFAKHTFDLHGDDLERRRVDQVRSLMHGDDLRALGLQNQSAFPNLELPAVGGCEAALFVQRAEDG
eukprot:6283577-Prymnesium_polylepis.1